MGDAPDAAALSDDPDAAADLAELLAGQKRKRAPRNQSKKAMKSAAGSARTVAAGSWQPPLTVLEVQLLTLLMISSCHQRCLQFDAKSLEPLARVLTVAHVSSCKRAPLTAQLRLCNEM